MYKMEQRIYNLRARIPEGPWMRTTPKQPVSKVIEQINEFKKEQHKRVRQEITNQLENIFSDEPVAIRIAKTHNLMKFIYRNFSYISDPDHYSRDDIEVIKISLEHEIIPETEEYIKEYNAEFAKEALELYNKLYNKMK